MATHSCTIEQGQGEHDVAYSTSGIKHWPTGYVLRTPAQREGRFPRQTCRDVITKAHKHSLRHSLRVQREAPHATQHGNDLKCLFSNLSLQAMSRSDGKSDRHARQTGRMSLVPNSALAARLHAVTSTKGTAHAFASQSAISAISRVSTLFSNHPLQATR